MRLYLRNSFCSIHLRVSAYFNLTFSEKTVSNPQMWDPWHLPPQGVNTGEWDEFISSSLRWLQWAEKTPGFNILGPEINVYGFQASADRMEAWCCSLEGKSACRETQANQALGPEGAIVPGSFRATEAKLWGPRGAEIIYMTFSSSLCWISGFTSLLVLLHLSPFYRGAKGIYVTQHSP